MTDDKITKLPIKFKAPPSNDGPMLQIINTTFGAGECNHATRYINGKEVSARYLIREGETEVECSLCETKLDPMFVIRKLAHEETKWHRMRDVYQAEMVRLNERKATKCSHCGKMTRISRK